MLCSVILSSGFKILSKGLYNLPLILWMESITSDKGLKKTGMIHLHLEHIKNGGWIGDCQHKFHLKKTTTVYTKYPEHVQF